MSRCRTSLPDFQDKGRRAMPSAHSKFLVNIVENHYMTNAMTFSRYTKSLVQTGSAPGPRAKSYRVLARGQAQTLVVRQTRAHAQRALCSRDGVPGGPEEVGEVVGRDRRLPARLQTRPQQP